VVNACDNANRWRPGSHAKAWSAGAMAVALLIAGVCFRVWQERRQPQPPEALAEGLYRVGRVVDGATLRLTNQSTVRLLGIDVSPAAAPPGLLMPSAAAADAFTRRFVTGAGGRVRLRLDRERLDRQGRFLAYVFAGDRMLNEELLAAGLARVQRECRMSASTKNRFLKLQAQARRARQGLWSTASAASDDDLSFREEPSEPP
jgi:micrococcal nuclease